MPRTSLTRLASTTPIAPLCLPVMLSETFIMHSRDPMPACNDDAWTLAGLDRVVDTGIYSRATMDEGRTFHSTTINLVVAPAGVHSSTLTWIGASSPDCHTEFELELPRDIGGAAAVHAGPASRAAWQR
ncbi:hypothetical protein T492DRAFT_1138452 [Pavlovales sp. CCMP2436]|nr:hypothetical protein T492DRAFT_1138452 [Pavlovales sp. CCMP2436]